MQACGTSALFCINSQHTRTTLLFCLSRSFYPRSPGAYRIVSVISDTEGVLGEDPGDGSPLTEQFCQGKDNWCAYDIMGKML